MSKKISAVEWLGFEINRRGPKEDNPPQWLKELYNQAKAMEKEQTLLFSEKYDEYVFRGGSATAEEYYEETFKSE